jgi:hypothetical protein
MDYPLQVGLDFKSWTEAKGLHSTGGAIFWLKPDDGPSVQDSNGKQGKGKPSGDIVIAQLTVPVGTSFDAQVNAQGITVRTML